MKWFQKEPRKVPTRPVDYPSDVAVETESGLYFIKGSYKMRFFSDRCFDSWSLDLLPSSDAAISKFKKGGVLGYRPGCLVKDISDGKFYLISDKTKRHIVSPDVFEVLGLDITRAIVASRDELNLHPEGEVLS